MSNPVLTLSGDFPREFAPGIHWLGWCQQTDAFYGRPVHIHTSAFVVVGSERALMYDTSLPVNWPALEIQLEAVLGDRPLDYVMPSHAELPHCGNIGRLLRKYPNALVVGDVRDYHLYFPEAIDRSEAWEYGRQVDLGGGYRVTVLEAPIKDGHNTVWLHEESQAVLFTSDAFSFTHYPAPSPGDEDSPEPAGDEGEEMAVHLPGSCTLMSSELGDLPTDSQAEYITKAALYWTKYVEFGPFLDQTREILEKYPTRLIAPSHGNVIDRIDAIMPVVEHAHRRALEQEHAARGVTPAAAT
jgi:flavorubredoxin